ncbi:MAG TPA: hypothetical protein PK916_09580 [Bacteroidota bacterium]|nr:hypothetical protein [Bacteroidota bacterium]
MIRITSPMYSNIIRWTGLLALALLTLWSLLFIHRTSVDATASETYHILFDDAMVTMRYARNFVEHGRPVWNLDERVQGYTHPLTMLQMSASIAVAGWKNALLVVKLTGLLLLISLPFVLRRLYREFDGDSTIGPGVGVLLVAYYPLAFWTLQGMETGLLAVGLPVILLLSQQFLKNASIRSALLLGGGLAVLPWIRLDTVIFVPAIIIPVLLYLYRDGVLREHIRSILVIVVMVLVSVSLQLLLQYLLYGEPLPNTARLKLGGTALHWRIMDGLGFIVPFLRESMLLLVVAAVALILCRSRLAVLIVALFTAMLAYQVYIGGDAWDYWRMPSPLIPLLLLLALRGLNVLLHSFRSSPAFSLLTSGQSVAIVAILLCGVLWNINARFLREAMLIDKPYQVDMNTVNVRRALALQEVLTDSAVVAVAWGGTVPYITMRPAVDILGKSDRAIAARKPYRGIMHSWGGMKSVPGHNKYDLSYSILQRRPDYIDTYTWFTEDFSGLVGTVYKEVAYKGAVLHLRDGSRDVRWELIDAADSGDATLSGIRTQDSTP